MAKILVTPTEVTNPYVGGTVLPATTALTGDGLEFRCTGTEIVEVSSAAGDTVTVVSTADPYNRTGDISIVLAAGEKGVWKSVQKGFIDSSGNINVKSAGDAVASVFRL